MAKETEWKTSFHCHFCNFQYPVMPFGLMNTPASFQHLINNILRGHLNMFYLAFIDKILQSSFVQAFQSRLQAAVVALDLVHNRQSAVEPLIGAAHNNLTHAVMSVREDLVKYL